MKRYSRFSLIVLCSVLLLAVSITLASVDTAEPVELDDDQRFTRLTALLDDEQGRHPDFSERAEVTLKRFGQLWSDEEFGDELHEVSDEVLSLRLRAADTAAFYRPAPWVLARYRAALEEAHARTLVEARDFQSLFDAYQVAWQFDAARDLRQRYPEMELPAVPAVSERPRLRADSARIVWRVESEPASLVAEVVELDGARLLVVSSPGCGFCRRAARDLPADAILGPLMAEHALWIAGPGTNNSFYRLQWWNDHFPAVPKVLVDDPERWPVDDFYRYPQFLFVQGERVERKFAGWQGGSKALQAIAEGFIELGLLDGQDLPDDAFAYADEPSGSAICATRADALERIRERAPINTREQLDAHLAALQAGSDSPLLALSEPARERLIDSLHFGASGVAGFRHDDLQRLEPEAIYRVVSLFGLLHVYAGIFFPEDLLSDEERDLRDRINCAGDYANDHSQ